MSRRIELELTSARDDGSWTWRAAGALQPRGELNGALLPPGAKVGDVLRAEADFDVDGITVVSVLPPKGARAEPERIELRPVVRDFQPVVTTLASRTERRGRPSRGDRPDGDRPDGPRRDRPRDDRPRDDRPRPDGPRGERTRPDDRARPAGDRPARPPRPTGGPDRPSRPRRERPAPPPPKPKPKKLRPGRVNRDALLATLPPEHHPIADQLFRGGIPAVRAAITEQNTKAKDAGQPEIPAATVLALAENLAPAVRLADWLDRAAAAVADAEVVALKDLRAVVHAADDVVREDATRPLVAELRAVLDRRATAEQQEWIDDITHSLVDGRVVRALRLASRSPQPNESLPAELTARLTEAAGAALTADAAPERWATVLDAIAYSPVRRAVTPVGAPAEPGEELLATVRKHAARVPKVGALFGIEPPARSGPAPRPKTAPRRAADVQAEAGLLPPPGARRIPPPPSPAPAVPHLTTKSGHEVGVSGLSPAGSTSAEAATHVPAPGAGEATARDTSAPEMSTFGGPASESRLPAAAPEGAATEPVTAEATGPGAAAPDRTASEARTGVAPLHAGTALGAAPIEPDGETVAPGTAAVTIEPDGETVAPGTAAATIEPNVAAADAAEPAPAAAGPGAVGGEAPSAGSAVVDATPEVVAERARATGSAAPEAVEGAPDELADAGPGATSQAESTGP